MLPTCSRCARLNPPGALFCHHDGAPLGEAGAVAALERPWQRFRAPFVFPCGRGCRSFLELGSACLDEWDEAVELLSGGAFEGFLLGLGRADLAWAARQSAAFPDRERGLARFLQSLPAQWSDSPCLEVEPARVDLGVLRVGQDDRVEVRVRNVGRGLLHGQARCPGGWLALGEMNAKLFKARDEVVLEVRVRGRALRAGTRPLAGEVVIESNGGRATVAVTARVPPRPFACGALAGARSPRQLAEQVRTAPGESARLFEDGSVERWYQANGWTYPVPAGTRNPAGAFLAAVGLAAPRPRSPIRSSAASAAPISWLPPTPTPPPPSTNPFADLRADTPAAPPPPPAPNAGRRRPWWVLGAVVGMAGLLLAAGLAFLPAGQGREDQDEQAVTPAGLEGGNREAAAPGNGYKPPRDDPPPPPPAITTQPERPGSSTQGVSTPPPLAVPEFRRSEVELVFCIDTTGSMGRLLDGAKKKIWAICNQVAAGRPVPNLKVGLVAYRDRGDEYITQVHDLNRDLDAVHTKLQTFKAAGGGDPPESVNAALDDTINRIRWSKDKKTLRIVFLVGDAPPHMDYTDDVKYPVTCKKARERGIVINAIQCGDDADCKRYWKDIAAKAGGEYAAIPQGGGVVVQDSPFDKRLAQINRELLDTVLLYGPPEKRQRDGRSLAAAKGLSGVAAADRAGFAGKSQSLAPYDLLDATLAKRVTLEKVPATELPDQLAKLKSLADRRAHLEGVRKRRADLYGEAVELDRKRAAHLAAGGGKKTDAFDQSVLEMLRKQARRCEISY
jgi:hypothetical protein